MDCDREDTDRTWITVADKCCTFFENIKNMDWTRVRFSAIRNRNVFGLPQLVVGGPARLEVEVKRKRKSNRG